MSGIRSVADNLLPCFQPAFQEFKYFSPVCCVLSDLALGCWQAIVLAPAERRPSALQVQSECFEAAYLSDINMVMRSVSWPACCAP